MKIYFAGAIRGGRDKQSAYAHVIKGLQAAGYTVLSEHVGDKDVIQAEGILSDEQIHNRDLDWIREADIVIADVSLPSLGVGYELAFATHVMGKPTFCYCEAMDNSHISAMIKGAFSVETYVSHPDYLTKVLRDLNRYHIRIKEYSAPVSPPDNS